MHEWVAAVAARRPVDARERASVAEFLEVVPQLAAPSNEHADRRHVTASAIVISDDRRRVVLHKHKRLGLWLQPGGHIDAGETPWQAAHREAREETGLPVGDVDPVLVHVDVHPGPRGHRHFDLRYVVTSPQVPPAPPEGESQDVQWFGWHRAIDMADAGLEGVLRSLQPGELSEVSLRPVRSITDAERCADVYLRSRAYAMADAPVPFTDNEVRRWIRDDLLGHVDLWMADLDGVAVGMMAIDHGWIEQLYLDPAWMGRGLGDRFLDLARQRSSEGLQTWTFASNGAGRRFLERHGFVAEEHTDGAGNPERVPDVRYRWQPA